MADDIYTAALTFETRGQKEAEQALRDNEEATKRYERATRDLSSRMKVSVNQAQVKAKTLGQLDAATRRAENEIKRLAKSFGQGAISLEQFQDRAFKIGENLRDMGMQDAQGIVNTYSNTVLRATGVVTQHDAAQKRLSQSKRATTQTTRQLTAATNGSLTAQQRARQQFLATANSVAVLDGPLGGVASRFSAFGVLIGRIGIPLAALAIGFAGLTFTAQRAIRNFTEFETQLATIENRLNSVGNQINLTSQEIVRMSDNIAISTLANEREVLSAANSLLTFRSVTTDLFEDVIRSAQDLAASGFGTLESETQRLAKAIEDPRQSLTSLSRAGITFTRQQREMIIAMVDTGREAEAMRLVLDNVERQVGGAGAAQANETLAGSFDTISQAFRRFSREAGKSLGGSGPFRQIIFGLEGLAQMYLESKEELEELEQLQNLQSQFESLNPVIEDGITQFDGLAEAYNIAAEAVEEFGFSVEGVQRNLARDSLDTARFIDETTAAIERRITVINAEADAKKFLNSLGGRSESLQDLQGQIGLQRELVGLTQEEARARRILADAGLASGAIENIQLEIALLERNIQVLEAAGENVDEKREKYSKLKRELQGAATAGDELRKVFEDQRTAREIQQIEDSTNNTNEILRRQVAILQQARDEGNNALTVTEARRQAELQLQISTLESAKNLAVSARNAAFLANNLVAAAEAAEEVARLSDIIAKIEEGADLQTMLGGLGRTSSGGGGAGSADPFEGELDRLRDYLETRRIDLMRAQGLEREIILEEYEERFEILNEALDRELLTKEEFVEKEIELMRSKHDRLRQIEEENERARLKGMSDFFGGMQGIAQAGGDKLAKTAAVFGAIQATIDAYKMAAGAAADTPGPIWVRMAAYAQALSTGLGAVAAIRGAGGGGSGGGRGRSQAQAPREAREAMPQRVLIEGLDPNALFTGEMLENLFESLMDENDNRGKVFVVNR